MVRNHRKKRRGFWDWLVGEEMPARSPVQQDLGPPCPAPEQGEDNLGPIPLEGEDRLPAMSADYSHRPCPICGSVNFRWDWLESGLYGLGKGPADAGQRKWVKIKTRFGDFVGLRARLCENCGHVDLFVPQKDES